MRSARAFTATVTISALAGCTPDSFRPIYYPNAGDLLTYTRGPQLDNLAQARQWAQDQAEQRRDANWDYEVGVNCRPFSDESDLEVCEDTVR
jgi:hypothetical protein